METKKGWRGIRNQDYGKRGSRLWWACGANSAASAARAGAGSHRTSEMPVRPGLSPRNPGPHHCGIRIRLLSPLRAPGIAALSPFEPGLSWMLAIRVPARLLGYSVQSATVRSTPATHEFRNQNSLAWGLQLPGATSPRVSPATIHALPELADLTWVERFFA